MFDIQIQFRICNDCEHREIGFINNLFSHCANKI